MFFSSKRQLFLFSTKLLHHSYVIDMVRMTQSKNWKAECFVVMCIKTSTYQNGLGIIATSRPDSILCCLFEIPGLLAFLLSDFYPCSPHLTPLFLSLLPVYACQPRCKVAKPPLLFLHFLSSMSSLNIRCVQ